MRVSEILSEGKRQKGLDYETILKGKAGEIDKVLVKIEGTRSAKFTKLAKEYKELQGEIKTLQTKMASNQDTLRTEMEELFDPADDVLTRVVETCSITLQLSKAVPAVTKTEVNYEKAFNELVKLVETMVPDLKKQVSQLVECASKSAEETKTSSGRKSSFTVKEGILGSFASFVKGVAKKITNWVSGYDAKLAKAKDGLKKLSSMQLAGKL